MKNLKTNVKKLCALGGITLILMGTSGCSMYEDIQEPTAQEQLTPTPTPQHIAYKYVNERGLSMYREASWWDALTYRGFEKQQEDFIILNENGSKFYEFMSKNNLLVINDNIEAIKNIQNEYQDYIEYQYQRMSFGGVLSGWEYKYEWTTDPNHTDLTGSYRINHYEYKAYKIEMDEKGNYVLVESPFVDDLLSIKDEYPYIKTQFIKKTFKFPTIESIKTK